MNYEQELTLRVTKAKIEGYEILELETETTLLVADLIAAARAMLNVWNIKTDSILKLKNALAALDAHHRSRSEE